MGVDSRSGHNLVNANDSITQSWGFPSKAKGINSAELTVQHRLTVTSGCVSRAEFELESEQISLVLMISQFWDEYK